MQQKRMNSGASSSLSSTSPSSTTYSSETLADIAARVVHELNLSLNDLYDDDDDTFKSYDDDVESEFEFAVISRDDESQIITADEIFYDGKIRPIYYPVIKANVVYGNHNDAVLGDESKTVSLEKRERGNDSVMKKRREKVNAVNNFYGYNYGGKKMEGVKRKVTTRKSYLPYRRDLLGFSLFSNHVY